MPTPQLKSFADEYGVPIDKVEEFWDKAKEQYGEDYEKVAGTVKKMCQNYAKGKNEGLSFNSILSSLVESSGKGDEQKQLKDMYNYFFSKNANINEFEKIAKNFSKHDPQMNKILQKFFSDVNTAFEDLAVKYKVMYSDD